MARYHQHHQRRYKGYTDLRDFLDDKHQRGEEPNSAPYDPPSLLRDPLRDDNLQNNRHPRNEFYRGRGRGQRRPNYNTNYNPNYTRPRGYNNQRGQPSRLPQIPTNIKIEFSTESGERRCQIQSENDISNKFNAGERGRGGNYRGRSRGYRRGRGQRGSYYRKPRTDQKLDSESSHTQENLEGAKIEEEENWDLPVEDKGNNQEKGSLDIVLKENENVELHEELSEYEEYHGEKGDNIYVEGEYLDEQEYYEGDEVQQEIIDEQSEFEEKEIEEEDSLKEVDDIKSIEKLKEKDNGKKKIVDIDGLSDEYKQKEIEVKNDLKQDLDSKNNPKESGDDSKESSIESNNSKDCNSKDSSTNSNSKNSEITEIKKSTEKTETDQNVKAENKEEN